jgi:hypothetical protein
MALLVFSGCIKIDSTIDIAPDGGGSWRLMYAMPTHVIRQIEVTSDMAKELDRAGKGGTMRAVSRVADLPYLFNEAAIKERFKLLESQGIILGKVQTRSHGGWSYVDLSIKFTRLETLLSQPFLAECGFALSNTGSGTCKLVVSMPDMGTPDELPNLDDPSVSERVRPFMNGLRVVSRIGVPGEIRNSNSSSSDSRRATWEWDFDKDNRALARLSQAKMIIVFDARDLRLRDFSRPARRE